MLVHETKETNTEWRTEWESIGRYRICVDVTVSAWEQQLFIAALLWRDSGVMVVHTNRITEEEDDDRKSQREQEI